MLFRSRLRAVNSSGAGTASASANGSTLPAAPSSPIASPIVGQSTKVSVAFTAPSGTITGYQFSIDGGTNWTTAAETVSPITVTGLAANSTNAALKIRAVTASGPGAATAAFSGTTVPGAPGIGEIHSETATSFVVPFTPYDGGTETIVRHEYSIHPDEWFTIAADDVTAGFFSVTGLETNTFHTVHVRAVSAQGAGASSAGAEATTTPGAPTALTASAVNGDGTKLTVSLTAPDGEGTITGYEYQVDGGSWVAAVQTTSPITVTGLSTGTTYSLKVRALNHAEIGRAHV